uniref:HECT-type E3 ubiquitin transferase n=1 Tax=Romanomermis culicivorax TaxID=13658 RepID=A0A915KJE7_ROMCU
CHTLTLVGNKLYAFGLNGSGQLGLGDVQSRLVPIASQLDKIISEVYAGGDHSFIICTSKDDIEVDHVESPIYDLLDQKCVAHLTLERLKHVLCKSVPHVLDELKLVLSNTPCLNGSFLKKDFKNYFTGRKNSGVDMDDVMEGFQLLNESAHSETFTKTMQDCIERHLIPKFRSSPPPDVEALRLFVILPWCPAFSCIERYRTLHMPFVSALLNLKPLPLEVIESWWSLFELRHFNRVLKIFKQVVVNLLITDDYKKEQTILESMLNLLAILHKVNSSTKKLPLDSFYVNELAEKVEIRQDYYLHINNPSDERFSFCNYPFIFNAGVKTLLLETDALLTQQTQMQQAHFNTFLMQLGLAPQNFPYLVLTVSRNNLVQDTINQLLSFPPNDLKKPLKVVFRGEEADDAGGVRKEFFMLLLTELLQPKYGMFVEYTESRKLWFAPHLFENDDVGMYKLIGILCGLAIYNGIIVALPFPLALYKKLLDQPTVLEDLKDLSPTEGRSLESLMDYDNDDFEDVFSLYFQVSIDIFGTSKTVDLKPDGGSLSVTKSNRQEYIDLYVDRKLNTSIADQFNAFKEGFHKAVASRILRFFQPIELMEMAVGNEQYDWYLFEKETVYKGDYWRYH